MNTTRAHSTAMVCVAALFGVAACSPNSSPEAPKPPAEVKPPQDTQPQKTSTLSDLELARERVIAPAVANLLTAHHLQPKAMDDAVSKDAFDLYLQTIDPGRLFLLRPQVDRLRADHAARIDDQMKAGRLELAEQSDALMRQQTTDVQTMVRALLKAPLPTEGAGTFETDASKRPWSPDRGAQQERWRALLTYQILQRLRAVPDGEDLVPHAQRAREALAAQYNAQFARLGKKGHLDALATLLGAVARVYDPHTTFLPPARRVQFDAELRGSAETFTRGALLKLPKTRAPVGYIQLARFYGDSRAAAGDRRSGDDVAALLDAMKARDVGALILDLRGNGGGFLDDARRICGFFIDQGTVVQTQHANGDLTSLKDETPGARFDGDLIVLVDHATSSAAEVLAAALQDYKRGLIVGDTTYGKGTVQILVDLDAFIQSDDIDDLRPLGSVRLTQQRFFRVNGASTQNRGVVPDIGLPSSPRRVSGERELPHALPWSAVGPAPFTPWSKSARVASGSSLTDLTARSRARRKEGTALHALASAASAPPTLVKLDLKAMRAQRRDDAQRAAALTRSTHRRARFQAKPLSYTPAVGEPDTSDEGWAPSLGQDPWLEEALRLVGDMASSKP